MLIKISKISEHFVLKELCKLNPTKSTGIDGIKPIFLKDGAQIIKSAITHIINLSIETEKVPDLLKQAIVKPLFKKGSRLEVGNYRPVSLLCIQSGFRKSFSTDTCLINLIDHIRMVNSQNLFAGMVLLDLQKAFDTVDHDIPYKTPEVIRLNSTGLKLL